MANPLGDERNRVGGVAAESVAIRKQPWAGRYRPRGEATAHLEAWPWSAGVGPSDRAGLFRAATAIAGIAMSQDCQLPHPDCRRGSWCAPGSVYSLAYLAR